MAQDTIVPIVCVGMGRGTVPDFTDFKIPSLKKEAVKKPSEFQSCKKNHVS